MKHIRLPLTEADIAALQAGDEVLLSGPLYTARDAAHQRLCRCLQEGKPLPVELAGETIYYVGPSPAKPGEVIGSAGPTTSYRMDPYTPPLLALGLKGMIGKGRRSAEVVQAIREHGAVYFITIGGAAALLAEAVKKKTPVCYEDLGPEAICRLEVENSTAGGIPSFAEKSRPPGRLFYALRRDMAWELLLQFDRKPEHTGQNRRETLCVFRK